MSVPAVTPINSNDLKISQLKGFAKAKARKVYTAGGATPELLLPTVHSSVSLETKQQKQTNGLPWSRL